MGMIRPINQSALRPALTPALGSARRGVSRYFTPLDQVAQAHITLTSVISLLGDFDLTVDVSAPFAGARMILGNVSAQACLFINDGNVSIRDTASVTVSSTTTPVIENKLNRIRAVKTSGNVELFVNGASVASGALGDFWFDRIGIRFTNNLPFNGMIANLVANDNGSNVINMPINRYYTPTSNIVLDESGNGNHGTIINIAAGHSKYYSPQPSGNLIDLQGNVLEVAY